MAKKKFRPPPPYGPKPAPAQLPKSVREINAMFNMFRQNYERSKMEQKKEFDQQWQDQYRERGYKDNPKQPVSPQFIYPNAVGEDAKSKIRVKPAATKVQAQYQYPPTPPPPSPQLPPKTLPKQVTPKKLAPKPKQVKPTLNSFIPRYERD